MTVRGILDDLPKSAHDIVIQSAGDFGKWIPRL